MFSLKGVRYMKFKLFVFLISILILTSGYATVSNPIRVDTRGSFGGRIASGVECVGDINGDSVRSFDTTTLPDGWHTLQSGSSSTRICVLNKNVIVHGGRLKSDETWSPEKVHIVRGNIVVPANNTLSLPLGAIVKFSEGTSISVEGSGKVRLSGVQCADIADDRIGGDINFDGEHSSPTTGQSDWFSLGVSAGSVSFDYGNGDPAIMLYYSLGETFGTLPTPTRSGYTFDGWYTSSSGGTKISSSTIVTGGVTYYAHWIAIYTVTFNANGGSVTPSTRTVTSGSAVGTLPTPTRSGYTFNGWYTSSSGGTKISSSTIVTGDVTYYAHWIAIPYTVTFNANGGSVTPSTRTVTSGSAIGTLPVPTRSGYTFDGWYTSSSGGAKISLSTVITSNVTYYAHWVVIQYTVTFNANGGSVSTSTYTVSYGSAVGTLPTPTRSGYTFDGWYTSSSGGTKISSSTIVTGGVTYYAHWIAIYTVTFNANGGSVTPSTRTVTSGSAVGTLPTPTRSGYTFDGWYTSSSGGTKISSSTIVTGGVTYYAQWKKTHFTVVLHKNDGTGTTVERLIKYGTPTALPGAAVDLSWAPRRGFSFMGWSTDEKSKTVWKKDKAVLSTTVPAGETVHAYAIWQLKTKTAYAIQYIRNDGSGSVRTVGFNGGEATKLNSVKALGFERRGYTFGGWANTTENARRKKVWKGDMGVVSQPVANGKLLKIYAIWTLKSGYYSIRFNKNDGTGKWRELGYEYAKNTTLPTIANGLQWTRVGYEFGGWATSAANAAKGIVWRGDAGGTRTPVAAGKTLNIYAIWRKNGAVAPAAAMLSRAEDGLSSVSGAAEDCPALLPGYYAGELADGAGTYDLLVDEDEASGYVRLAFADGTVIAEEVEIDFADGIIVVTVSDGEMYELLK